LSSDRNVICQFKIDNVLQAKLGVPTAVEFDSEVVFLRIGGRIPVKHDSAELAHGRLLNAFGCKR